MSAKTADIVTIAVVVLLSLAILANSMSKPIGRDEQMYCTAGVLTAQGKMVYRDFSYAAQLPYHPLLYAAVYRLTGTSYYLLAGRMISVVCDVLIMVCIIGIYRQVFRDAHLCGSLFGLAALALYLFNPLVDYANGYAWNHDVVILCVVAASWLYLACEQGRCGWWSWKIAVMGALLTFASCMRITTVLAQAVFFAMLLSGPAKSLKERCGRVLPFLVATALVLIWPIWVILQAPQAFYLNIVKIPQLYGRWLADRGMVFDKLELTAACLRTPAYLALLAFAAYLGLAALFLRGRIEFSNWRCAVLGGLLAVIFFVIAWIPPTMWRQYLAMPVPFIVIALALPLRYLRKLGTSVPARWCFKVGCLLAGMCVFAAVASNPVVLQKAPLALVPEHWVPVAKHKIAEQIAPKVPEPKKVLTLAPLLALEGRCSIYTELAAGSIIYRIGDLLTARQRALTHTVGPSGIKKLVETCPASAVVVGVEAPHMAFLEKPLAAAVASDWRREVCVDGTVVFVRP